MAETFTAIHTYSDPGLEKHRFSDYELFVRLSAEAITYCVSDINTGKYLHLESYDLSEPGRKTYIPGDSEMKDTAKLTALLENDLQWLTNNFNKTRVLVDQGNSTLVPEALFNENEKGSIFEFNIAGGPYKEDELHHDQLQSVNAYALYHVPAGMTSLIEKFFPGAAVYHHSTSTIQSLYLKYMNQENDRQLFVNTGKSRLDILRLQGKKLEYFNSFRYNTAEDFMYYLIFVVEQLGLNPESVELMMVGEIDRHSTLSDLILKYIRNVQFIKRNEELRYSFVFDQLPGHYYYNLLNASLCE